MAAQTLGLRFAKDLIKEVAGKVVDWMEKISDQQYQLGAKEVIAGYRTEQIVRTACNLVGADFQLIVGQAHRAQERVPAGVASEVRKVWVSPQTR